MAEFAEIAGQNSLILNSKEALSLHTNLVEKNPTAFLDSISESTVDHLFETPNDFPVVVYNGFILPQGGVYSDKELKVGLATGHVICDPAPSMDAGARINASSIDVTLGHYFYSAGEDGTEALYNPFDKDDTMRYFNITTANPDDSALEAKPWAEVKKPLGQKAIGQLLEQYEYLRGIPEHHPMILLRPNERILAHTNEFIGIIPPGTTSMQARSSFGRIGVSVCYDAGWGDPGFADRWTKEIKNHNENDFVPLPEGMRDAQIVFMSTGPVEVEYSTASGNYQRASFAAAHEELNKELGRKLSLSEFDPSVISTSGLHMVSKRFRSNLKNNWRPSHTVPQLHTNKLHSLVEVEGLSGRFI